MSTYFGHSLQKIVLWVFILLSAQLHAQAFDTLGIARCYELARQNYPLIKEFDLIHKTEQYSLDNASKGYWPQSTISGQATYQSAVTQIPISLPNISIPGISKDQYKIYGELIQPITDIATTNRQKNLIRINAGVEQQKLETEFYKLHDRINQVFFGILLLDEQLKQNALLQSDIQSGIRKTEAGYKNGTMLKSSSDILRAEYLKADQHRVELQAMRSAYVHMLAAFIGNELSDTILLNQPEPMIPMEEINRPELRLYDLQKQVYQVQNTLLDTRNMPHLNLFFQGGYGRPALNFLSNDLDAYYITGLRLNWNLSNYYTSRKERKILELNQQMLEVQKEVFVFNTQLSITQLKTELKKYQELISTDQQIIQLRQSIKLSANAQLEYGSITSIDYLSYLNEESQARESLALHQMQELLTQYNFQTTTGN